MPTLPFGSKQTRSPPAFTDREPIGMSFTSLPSGTFGSVVIHNPTDLPPLETTANSIMAKAIEWGFMVQPKPFVTRTLPNPDKPSSNGNHLQPGFLNSMLMGAVAMQTQKQPPVD